MGCSSAESRGASGVTAYVKNKIHLKPALMMLGVFIAGIALGLAGGSRMASSTIKHSHLHSPSGRYRFTNPLLDCDIASEKLDIKEFRPFKHKVKELVDRKLAAGDVSTVSIYLRNLDNGASFGVNTKELYSPASLLKVPLMMAWLKRAERDPAVLRQTFLYDGSEDLTAMQNIKPHETLRPGTSYTVDELIYRMLAYSDNKAWWVLLTNMDTRELDAIVADLQVDFDPAKAAGDFISVKSYSRLYRVLYNATFLGREMSEKALQYLSHIDFREGIAASVPTGVPVASKFGEKVFDNGKVVELHEFGIVYHPVGPYLLGIMTKGNDFRRQAAVIREISTLVYSEVSGLK